MKAHLNSIILADATLTMAAPLSRFADNTNASAKVTLQTSYLNVLGLDSMTFRSRHRLTRWPATKMEVSLRPGSLAKER